MILCVARRAHPELGHGGEAAVIGDVLNNGVARAAMGAIGERVAQAAVGGIAKIREESSQVAISGGTSTNSPGAARLSRISKAG